MSTTKADSETALPRECPVIDGRREIQHIAARASDVGGIPVARALPSKSRRLIGAWCFLDHIGPTVFDTDAHGLRVGAHPHIGLQTFTWLIEGRILHRDSLGFEQEIRPGQVNLMTAGRGISHTEDSVAGATRLHGAQLWIALPYQDRDTDPRFDHYTELPRFALGDIEATLLTGEFGGHTAPTLQFCPLVGMELTWGTAMRQEIEVRPEFEYGILPLAGALTVSSERLAENELAYLGISNDSVELASDGAGRALLIGGIPFDGAVTIWWNFVAHDRADIERATDDWNSHSERFGHIDAPAGGRLDAPSIPWRR